jgi:UDP-N-acetylmuramoyl-tripeptide--D-alanyl-D-alanine ligase
MQDAERMTLEQVAARLLRGEIRGVSTDSRTIRRGELFVALRGDRFDGHAYVPTAMEKGAWGAVVEHPAPEAPQKQVRERANMIVVEDTLGALQELAAIHRRQFTIPVVAVTGTNGKTTTKEMLAAVLDVRGPLLRTEGNLNNHIGVPLTLCRLTMEHTAAVIEMGMSGPGEIALLTRLARPTVGLITNIGPAHLQFLGSTDAVARAKGELLEAMEPGGTAVLNADDRYFAALRQRFPGRTVSFGIGETADVRATEIARRGEATAFRLQFGGGSQQVLLPAVGRHNVLNALAAAVAAIVLGMSLADVRTGLEAFRPAGMRSEIRQLKGRTVLADCYNANPASMEAALEALVSLAGGRRTVAVLGDMLELGDGAAEAHRGSGRAAARLGTGIVIAVGELGRFIAEGARQAGMDAARVFEAAGTTQAATLLREHSQPGDVVLVKGSRGMRMETILEEL